MTTALDEFDRRETAKREQLGEIAYVRQLIRGVDESQSEIDQVITSHLKDWTLNRLFPVDRAILRLAVWELLHSDTPRDAVRAEALALAAEYGSDDATRFIGGILGAVVRES